MAEDTTILIIEDEALIADMIVAVLQKNGYRAVWHGSAKDALDDLRMRRVEPALILLDGILPGMDGWEFMAAFGREAALTSIPIVTMSSLMDFDRSKAPEGVRVVGALDKPFTPSQLMEKVKEALGR